MNALFFLAQQSAAEELADIREPVHIVDWMFWSIGSGMLLILGILAWILIRRYRARQAARPAGPPPIPPAQWARQALKQIAAEQEKYSDKDYSSAVSHVVREYLERALDVPAPEQTTEEFLVGIGTNPLFTTAMRQEMSAFLERCDLVKFAGQQLSHEERPRLLESARSFVATTEQSQPAVQSPAA